MQNCVAMLAELITASVDPCNVTTHCAFCCDYFDDTERWDCFSCWDVNTTDFSDDDKNVLFLICEDCRLSGSELYNSHHDHLFFMFPNESTLFRVDAFHGVNY